MYIKSGSRFRGAIDFKPEEWFLLTVVYNKGNYIKLYKDETRKTINKESTNGRIVVQGPNQYRIMFGSNSANRYYRGSGARFDDMLMWNRPLTSEEVSVVIDETSDK